MPKPAENQEEKIVERVKLVVFELAQEEYGVSVLDVLEVIMLAEITPIPNSPDYILGFINLRGKVIPIVDIEKRFGLTRQTNSEKGKILLVDAPEAPFGIVVDDVKEVLQVEKDKIQATPDVVTSKIGANYITGVVVLNSGEDESSEVGTIVPTEARTVLLLNLKELMSSEDSLSLNNLGEQQDGQIDQ